MKKKDVLLISFIIGFCSLVYEIFTLKVLFFHFNQSEEALGITLASFLLGLAVSGLVFTRKIFFRKLKEVNLLGILIFSSVIYAVLVLKNLNYILDFYESLSNQYGKISFSYSFKLVSLFFYIFWPAFFLGGALPILIGLNQEKESEKFQNIGNVYFWDTLGGVLASVLTGIVFIPVLGLYKTLAIPLFCSFFVLLYLKQYVFFGISFIVCILSFYVSPVDVREEIPYEIRFGEVLFQENSNFGVVTVGKIVSSHGFTKTLFINYRQMCSSKTFSGEREISLGVLKNLNVKNLKVLNIGLGCGHTAKELVLSELVTSLDLVEINKVVKKAYLQEFTNEVNLIFDKKVNFFLKDGANWIHEQGVKNKKYNAVVIDIEEPGVIQSSKLYTLEYFKKIRKILSKEGVFALWAVDGGTEYNQIIYSTLKQVFPYVLFDEENHYFISSSKELYLEKHFDTSQWNDKMNKKVNTLNNRILDRTYDVEAVFHSPKGYDKQVIKE